MSFSPRHVAPARPFGLDIWVSIALGVAVALAALVVTAHI